jgi:hypothetical protein
VRTIAWLSIAALLGAFSAHAGPATAGDPQDVALAALRDASDVVPVLQTERGLPRTLSLSLPVGGATPVERARAFVDSYAALFQQDAEALSLVPAGTWTTDDGDVVVFSQRYLGLPVFAARLVVVLTPPDLASLQSRVRRIAAALATPPLDVAITPQIDAHAAEAAARTALGHLGGAVLGHTELMLFAPAVFGEDGEPRLVWSTAVDGSDGPTQALVDATSGALVRSAPLGESGNGLDLRVEDAQFSTQWDFPFCFNFGAPTIGNENGLAAAYLNDVRAAATWKFAKQTYESFFYGYGIRSWDENDGEIKAYPHANAPNARYSSWCGGMEFNDSYVGQDILSHEFVHGLIAKHPSDLKYQGQSGALNEALADTLATLIVDPLDYLIGEDRIGGKEFRSLRNPPAFGDPDRMANFVVTQADDGGVHTNSGIINKAFYLMAQGDTFNNVIVTGMGQPKAAWLALELARYLPSSSQFMDARNWAVLTAYWWSLSSTHGYTASDLCTVRNGFAAVGLGNGDANCDGVENGPGDSDGDGIIDSQDNCPGIANLKQRDVDHDGIGDACDTDPDSDGDGWPNNVDNCPFAYNPGQQNQDGDSMGDVCDGDVDGDGWGNGADNCYLPNPDQADGDGDGIGDVCDPDYDGDGVYNDDNCTFVANPTQTDSDGDGYGDACDLCPNTPDAVLGYTVQIGDEPPKPLQPDSDDDGVPDACDDQAFGLATLSLDGSPWNPLFGVTPNGGTHGLSVEGPPDAGIEIPFPVCDAPAGGAAPVGSADRIDLSLEGLATEDVAVSVADELGRTVALAGFATPGGGLVGLRFQPDCGSKYFLRVRFGDNFDGSAFFLATADVVAATGENPWSNGNDDPLPAPELPDTDGDGSIDLVDNCPGVANPAQEDFDGDGLGDACDLPEPGTFGGALAALLALRLAKRRTSGLPRGA